MLECKIVLSQSKIMCASIIAYNSSMECTCNIQLQLLSFSGKHFRKQTAVFRHIQHQIETKKQSRFLSTASFSLWYHQESNRGHKDFQSFALPTELWHLFVFSVIAELRVQK